MFSTVTPLNPVITFPYEDMRGLRQVRILRTEHLLFLLLLSLLSRHFLRGGRKRQQTPGLSGASSVPSVSSRVVTRGEACLPQALRPLKRI